MKLTDKEIIEALKAGKTIKLCGGAKCIYRLDEDDNITLVDRSNPEYLNVNIFKYDFEIVEPEIDWDKVIEEKYLCWFWNCEDTPREIRCLGILTLISKEGFFRNQQANYWKYCRPLQVDEVKLVTDEKEIWK